jgi:hypothetical protein
MAGGIVEFNTGLLHAGSDSSWFAGAAARKAADRLSGAALPQGIFGEFNAAERFHSAVSTAMDTHVQRAQDHHARLTDIAGKGHVGARALSDTDAGAARALDSAGDQLGVSGT